MKPSGLQQVEVAITAIAKGMIAIALIGGGLAGLALVGVASFGPAFRAWAAERGRSGWLVVAFVVWPLLGLLYVALEGLFESLRGGTTSVVPDTRAAGDGMPSGAVQQRDDADEARDG